jgi:hypothetical protein
MSDPKPWDGIFVVSDAVPDDTIIIIEVKQHGDHSSFVVHDHVYCLKRHGDPVPLKALRDLSRVAPKDAVMCGRKDCGHG